MTSRINSLDQALDIAGSLIKSATYTLLEEPNSLGSPVSGQFGISAQVTDVTSGIVTLDGLSGMTVSSIGRFITIADAADPNNNGTFLISSYISATSVTIVNASGVFPDANSGSLTWTERNPYSLEDDLNYIRTDRAAIKGVNYYDSIPTYVRPTATNINLDANLSNISGHTTDAKVIVTNRKFENVTVNEGDTYITLTDVGNLKHADAIDITGVPIWDGYDSGNWNSCYVEFASNLETELIAYGGLPDGYRIFGRVRAGSGASPDSIEIEFRAVELGANVSSSIPYTWDGYQPTVIDVYYPYRDMLSRLDENALRILLVNGLVNDAGKDTNLYSLIGAPENSTNLNGLLNNTGSFYPFYNLPNATPSVVDALNTLNEQVGDRNYTGTILTDGYSITASLQELANALSDANCVRIIERVNSAIPAGTTHTLPGGATYTVDPSGNAKNMWVFARGVLRDPGSVSDGNEYQETSSTSITFYFRINAKDHINYIIYK